MARFADRAARDSRSFLKRPVGCSGLAAVCLGACLVLGAISAAISPRRSAGSQGLEVGTATPAVVAPVGSATVAAPSDPAYRVLREDPSEDAQKAQVDARLLVEPSLAPEELRTVLGDYLSRARDRVGWRRHERTTHVFAYAYASEADASGSGAGWVAMLTWRETFADAEPLISVDEDRHEAARHPIERDGLPEARRRQIYRALWDADYASARAGRTEDDANARRIARRFGVSLEQVERIGIEGVQRGW